MSDDKVYEEMVVRYASGEVPWEAPLPPPEVMALASSLPAGRVLDVGCGLGRASVWLASQGWQVTGVDFVAGAVADARLRAQKAGVTVDFHVGDVSELGFLAGPYDLVIDVGCGHALRGEKLSRYRDGVLRLLKPGGDYLLFARLRSAEPASDDGPRGFVEADARALFTDGFDLKKIDFGMTGTWPSAWFHFQKRVANF